MSAPLLITGATGTLGVAFQRISAIRGLEYVATSRAELDIGSLGSTRAALDRIHPWAVINTAGYVRVDDAEADAQRCIRENADGVAHLATAASELGIPLVTFSSDLVFNGDKRQPYVESDAVSPLSVYGASKAASEASALARCERALVIRTAAFFGPWDVHNFAYAALQSARENREFVAAEDLLVSPTYVPDLVDVTLDLLIDEERGIWHLANEGAQNWADFARAVLRAQELPPELVRGASSSSMGFVAPRPQYSALRSERGWIMPTLEDALERFSEWVDTPTQIESSNEKRDERADGLAA
jgi:dTDP-4-dehydrorhamnose reductase